MDYLVSIITPCYNSASFISFTIESVLSQTYQNWEMIIVDDCSTDTSAQIILNYQEKDNRIKYIKTATPSGSPTIPRNIGIKEAKGKYIAFLDSDDLWLPHKLAEQIKLFAISDNKVAIIFSYYEKISENGVRNNRVIKSPSKVTYQSLLNGNVIGCLTAIYDQEKVGKIYMKLMPHEDYILWLNILKKGYLASNTNTITALYRLRKGSVSANKIKTLKWQWNIYRKEEKLNLFSSIYHFINYSFKAFIKALK